MNHKSLIFLLVGLMVGVVLGAMIIFAGNSTQAAPNVGDMVEELNLQGMQQSLLKLSQFRGKVVVLNFWATWCVPCKDEMPLLQRNYDIHGDSLVVIGVNSRESETDVKNYLDANQISFPIALDLDGEISRKFLIQGYPTTYFIDAGGVIRAEHIGSLNETLLAGYLQAVGLKP